VSDTDNEKPKLGMRQPLGLKRTVETGKVKQSFSHGRSNTVVVEVKRRRILGPPKRRSSRKRPHRRPHPRPRPLLLARRPPLPRPHTSARLA
jgi:translation initiation factor IF-2